MIWLISEDIGYLLAGFRLCQLFYGLFQIVPGWFQMALDGFRSSHVVRRFSKYLDVLIKRTSSYLLLTVLWVEEDWENNVTTDTLRSWVRKEHIIQNIYLYPLKTLNCTSIYWHYEFSMNLNNQEIVSGTFLRQRWKIFLVDGTNDFTEI